MSWIFNLARQIFNVHGNFTSTIKNQDKTMDWLLCCFFFRKIWLIWNNKLWNCVHLYLKISAQVNDIEIMGLCMLRLYVFNQCIKTFLLFLLITFMRFCCWKLSTINHIVLFVYFCDGFHFIKFLHNHELMLFQYFHDFKVQMIHQQCTIFILIIFFFK